MKKKVHKKEEDLDLPKGHHFVKKNLEIEEQNNILLAEESGELPEGEENSSHSFSKKTKNHIEKQLAEIYKNNDGSLPNMTSFEKRKKRGIVRAMVSFALSIGFFGVVLYAGYFYLQPGQKFSQNDVTLSLTAEETVTPGMSTHYRVRYRNDQSVPITKAKVSVRYPDGFIFEKSSIPASSDAGNEWDISTLGPQDSGYIDIFGKIYGDAGSEKSIRAFLTYTPANFSSEFQSVAVLPFQITEAPVALSITAPEITAKNQLVTVTFTATPRNNTSFLQNITLVVDPGTGFNRKTVTPESDNFGAWQWSFPELKSEKSITVTGAFSGDQIEEETPLKVKLLGTFEQNGQKHTYLLTEKQYIIKFNTKQLESGLSINGALSELVVSPGDALSVKSIFKNNLDTAIQNITAKVVFEAPSYQDKSILNWAKLSDEHQNTITGEQLSPDIRRGTISWNGAQIPALKSLPPGMTIEIPFSIPLKSHTDIALAPFKQNKIQAILEVQYEQNGVRQAFASAPITIGIHSDLGMEVIQTSPNDMIDRNLFAFTWNLWNTFHPVTDVQVVASIFGDIHWKPESLVIPGGDFQYDEKEKKLMWKFSELGVSTKPKTLKFGFIRDIYNPTQTQLISKVEIRGKDMVTGEDIIVVVREIPNTP